MSGFFLKKWRVYFSVLVILPGIISVACNRLGGSSFVPAMPGYSEKNKKMTILKRPLREISGIDYISNTRLAAINDEAGKLFFVNPENGQFESFEFGKPDDYEDVVKAGDAYFIMNSLGHLYKLNAATLQQEQKFEKDFGKGVEFESMYFDAVISKLVLVCKQCGRGAEEINAWTFDITSSHYEDAVYFTISWRDIKRMAKDNTIETKPSAAAINPANSKLYIIASLGKVLLECSRNGKLENVYGLNPDHFPQPEGITFSPSGNMYISNEGVQGKGTILKFEYNP